MEQKKNDGKMVKTITQMAEMVFIPQINQALSGKPEKNYFFSSWMTTIFQKLSFLLPSSSKCQVNQKQIQPPTRLKYLEKLTAQDILIGNEQQIDLINISNIYQKKVYTEHLWSLKDPFPIDRVIVDNKRDLIATSHHQNNSVKIYRYNHRKIEQIPILLKQLKIKNSIKCIRFLKDYLFVICEKCLKIYSIQENQIFLKESLIYQIPNNIILKFYAAPHPFETTVNIFFQSSGKRQGIFTLWLIEVELTPQKDIKIYPLTKVYDIKKQLKKKIILKNYSKEFFLVNLGSEILLFKRSYVIDSAYINIKSDNSVLKYKGDSRLLHLSDKRFQIYQFHINTTKKPSKMNVEAIDSIQIKKPENSEFFNILEVMNGSYMVVFQVHNNKKSGGQINYWFAITQDVTLKEKLNEQFSSKKVGELDSHELAEKCDTARKMGMTNQQIFLQLWNRSDKVSDKDFSFLLSTENYQKIHYQISRKLKKSMNLSKVNKYESQCLKMLEQKMTGKPALKTLLNYTNSHFFLKKLDYWKSLSLYQKGIPNSENAEELIKISLPEYYALKNMHLKNQILSLINSLCLEKKNYSYKIRFMLKTFRLPITMIYRNLAEEVVKTVRQKVLILLKEIPEFLPYEQERPYVANQPPYHGIWEQITKFQLQQNLIIPEMKTHETEELFRQLEKDINFRRSKYEGHGVILQSVQNIKKNFEKLKSAAIFYSMIEWVFKYIQKDHRKEIFSYIQNFYPMMPYHLRNRIILYHQIFHYLEENKILPIIKNKPYDFHSFLSFDDQDLFYHLFEKEKQVKGLILKQIKPIYDRTSNEGSSLFVESLSNYIKSKNSEISDIKLIFNRINNEKKQFHLKNQEMYESLVEAMGHKLMIGTQKDIPLLEILIYVENLPISIETEIYRSLRTISTMKYNESLLQEAKVNMSIEQILNNPNKTMDKVIDYLIRHEKIRNETNQANFIEKSYHILAQAECLHDQIYKGREESPWYLFFSFTSNLAEEQANISNIKGLLENKYLRKDFNFDDTLTELLFLYMYLRKMEQNSAYIDNKDYLKTLLTLLPEGNQIKNFVICEFEFATIFSRGLHRVSYPISQNKPSPGLLELEIQLQKLQAKEIVGIDPDVIHGLMYEMSQLNSIISEKLRHFKQQEGEELFQSIIFGELNQSIKRREVYEQFILRLLKLGEIGKVITFIEEYLIDNSQNSNKSYDIVYPLILIIALEDEVNYEQKRYFQRAASCFFNDPLKLFKIIKKFLSAHLTSAQRTDYLRIEVLKGEYKSKGLNIKNQLLSQQLISIAYQQGLQNNLQKLLQNTFFNIQKSREDFKNISYRFLFIMLINKPYVAAKYLVCLKQFYILKNIRIFLTQMTKEDTFNSQCVIEFGRRLFLAALYSGRDEAPIESVIKTFEEYPLNVDLPEKFRPNFPEQDFFKRLWRSSQAFRKEKQKVKQLELTSRIEDKTQILMEELQHPELAIREQPAKYEKLFQDQDFDIQIHESAKTPSKRKNIAPHPANLAESLKNRLKKQMQSSDDGSQEIRINVLEASQRRTQSINESNIISSNKQSYYIHINSPTLADGNKLQVHGNQQKIRYLLKKNSLSLQSQSSEKRRYQRDAEIDELLEVDEESHMRSIRSKSNVDSLDNQINKGELGDDLSEITDAKGNKGVHSQGGINPKILILENLPSIQDISHRLHYSNLLHLENQERHIFDIELLKKFKNHPHFLPNYLQNIIQCLYAESEKSPLPGIIRLIENIVVEYPGVNISIKNLDLFKKADQIKHKFGLDVSLRRMFPIQTIFNKQQGLSDLFEEFFPFIKANLEEENLYQIAKMTSQVFNLKEAELEVVFGYLCVITEKYTFSKPSKKQQKQFKQKASYIMQQLGVKILIIKFDEIVSLSQQPDLVKFLVSQIVRIVEKKGNQNEMHWILQRVVRDWPEFGQKLHQMR